MAIRILNFWLFLFLLVATSCRHDELVDFVTDTDTGQSAPNSGITGLYILCEGNMGSNKCTLDYLDLSGGQERSHYYRNIYGDRNPQTVKELGDVGNDIGIYGSKLWMVINCSNKVEVCDATTTRRIGQVNIPNCRYLAFHGDYAYVSSYVGPVQVDSHSPLGCVYKVDTLTLQRVDSVVVAYQPEQMAIVGKRLYVANSGGYRVPDYDNRISVIDLDAFQVIDEIVVDINLHRMVADRLGRLWVTSRGDFFFHNGALYCIDLRRETDNILRFYMPVTSMSLAGDSLYYIMSSFSYLYGENSASYGIIDVVKKEVVNDGSEWAEELRSLETPYAILVNPIDRDFYVMDAKNYVSSGELIHLTPSGSFDWRVWTGDIPSCGAFVECKR